MNPDAPSSRPDLLKETPPASEVTAARPEKRPSPPRLSVIIPTHDDAPTLPRVLDCVLAQDFTDFEVVIVNDAGPSPRDFLNLEDSRVRLVDLSQNGGVSLARNRGLQETRGEIVFFLDADDYVAPDLFRIAIDALERCGAPVLSVGMMTIPEDEIDASFGRLRSGPRGGRIVIQSPRETFEDFRTNSGRYIPSVTFLRRDALVAHMGEAPWKVGLRNNQDALLFLTMAARHDHAHLSDRLVIYTRRPGSLSASDPARSWTGRIEAMDLLLAHLRGRNADPELIRIARHLRQGAARRVARIRAEQGRANEGRRVLREDLSTAFNWKSAVELLRYFVPHWRHGAAKFRKQE